MDRLKVMTTFSGYDSQCMSLKDANIDHECVATSEVDKHAIIANASVHGKDISIDENISLEEKYQWLLQRNIGFDFVKNKSTLKISKKTEIENLYKACKQINNLGDISKINPNEIPDIDFLTYSFPCFVAGSLIMTNKGYKKIEEIKIGDMVLTHTNSFKKVILPMINKTKELYELKTMCSEPLYGTSEHPFYIRE